MKLSNPYTLPTIEFVGGSTQDLRFHCYFHLNKEPFDLSSCEVNFALINYVNKNGSPLVSKKMNVSSLSQEDDVVSNVVSVTLDPVDTIGLAGKFIYQISIRDVSGEVEIPDQGIMQITNNINKAFVQ